MRTLSRTAVLAALLALAPRALLSCGGGPDAGTPPGAPAGAAREWAMSEEDARRMFPLDQPGYEYDPLTYFRLKPHADYEVDFHDYPGGHYRVRTNASSMREDEDVRAEQPDLRVLVTGDSHTDGVCPNQDSYPNVLEARLAARRPGKSIEVLNCGTGSYTFVNYLGVLTKFLDLRPDAFVMGVFGGNDFGEVLEPWHYFQGTHRPTGDKDYERRLGAALRAANGFGSGAVSQGFNQYFYFHCFPEQMQVALEAALTVTDEIARTCAERDIAYVVLYIPPPTEVEFERFRAEFEEVTAALEMDPKVFQQVEQLGARYRAVLREKGVTVIDAHELFAAGPGPWYWHGDLHIDLDANRAVAKALEAALVAQGL